MILLLLPAYGFDILLTVLILIPQLILSGKIEDAITAALEQWLPYVTVEQIDVESTSNNRDNNLVNVSVTFGLLNQVDLNTVSFTIAA